jgi:hypothetical protein
MYDSSSKNVYFSLLYTGSQASNSSRQINEDKSSNLNPTKPNDVFNFDKLETEHSVITSSSKKNISNTSKFETPIKSIRRPSLFSKKITNNSVTPLNKNKLNILSMIKMIDNKGPLIRNKLIHFEDKAETIQLLNGNRKVLTSMINEETPKLSYMIPINKQNLMKNIKLNNQMSYILENQHILKSANNAFKFSVDKKCSIEGSTNKIFVKNKENNNSDISNIILKDFSSTNVNLIFKLK